MNKAVLLDRDGVINEMVYYPEHGIVDSPFTVEQFTLVEGIGEPLRRLKDLGYSLILVSNQPGVAKDHFTIREFEGMRRKMRAELKKVGFELDGEYYCFHHPAARVKKYREDCDCRKPKPGLIMEAASERGLSLRDSFVIGDGLIDVLAGRNAGCRTILIGNTNSLLTKLMKEMGAVPDFEARSLAGAARIIEDGSGA